MKFILLITLFSLTLFANNPKAYSAIGDDIYNNVSKIEKLKDVEAYKSFTEKIDMYVSSVSDTKELGFAVASGKRSNIKLDYLSKLRGHKEVNDSFLRSVSNTFKSAIDSENSKLFLEIVNSGLLNIELNKKEVLGYYKLHMQEINPKGAIQELLDEEYALKHKKRWKPKTKKQLQEEKITRLRKNDKLDREALEKKLSEEVRRKKEEIRKNQERELFN